MVDSMKLAQQMAETKASLTLMAVPRVVHLACQTMKDVSTAGYLAGMMAVTKDALMNLDFHLAVM